MRLRILFGMTVLVAGLAVYALLAMRLAVEFLPAGQVAALLYYAVAGMAWLYPAALLTKWMQAPDPPKKPR
jgi:hypothetical protein